MVQITFDIDPEKFREEIVNRALKPKESMSACLEALLAAHIVASFRPFIESGSIIDVRAKSYPWIAWLSFKEIIAAGGYETHYLEFTIDTPRDVQITESDILPPTHLKWIPMIFGGGIERYFKFRKTEQKTKNKYEVQIYRPKIPGDLLKLVYDRHFGKCDCPPEILTSVPPKTWDWWICYGCKICGTRFFCECFRLALSKEKENAEKCEHAYAESGWPHRFLADLRGKEFRPGICHICTDTPSDLGYCHEMYGSEIKVRYGCYIKKTAIETGSDEREAENIIREKIGVPKIGEGWISETQLYKVVRALFPGHTVLREASPDWLGKQRLDIFIPELNLAIEYQGKQHYEPVAIFGGEEGFENTRKRDALKKSLCKSNRVELLYFRHDENVTEESVEHKLQKFIGKTVTSPK
ncbi:MAG: hypothetical protein HY696_09200 [Deltaproteobacteria bacterium]|nr:hypothetical protein [Deltaproteobacteria bacterium]